MPFSRTIAWPLVFLVVTGSSGNGRATAHDVSFAISGSTTDRTTGGAASYSVAEIAEPPCNGPDGELFGDRACHGGLGPCPGVAVLDSLKHLEHASGWEAFKQRIRDRHRISVTSYVLQGVNVTSGNPTNPPGGVGTLPAGGLIYRANEYMFNRLTMILDRKTQTNGCGWDIGGQLYLLYGTDYFVLRSRGLEAEVDLTNKWASDDGVGIRGALHGLAIPQMYLTVAHDDLSVKLGHFLHPLGRLGFEPLRTNLTYTQTYSVSFAEFKAVTGAWADWKYNDRLSIFGGFHRGNRNWEDNNDVLNGFGGFHWSNQDGSTELDFYFDFGAEDDAGVNDQFIQSLVLSRTLCDNWSVFLKAGYGHVENAGINGSAAEWYGLVALLLQEVSEKLVWGIRYEWFDDADGSRVLPRLGFPGLAPGVWQHVDVGPVYKPDPKLWLRGGLRWDWFGPDSPTLASGPFNDNRRSQFLAYLAMLYQF